MNDQKSRPSVEITPATPNSSRSSQTSISSTFMTSPTSWNGRSATMVGSTTTRFRFRHFVDDMLRFIPDEPHEENLPTWRGPRLTRAIANQNLTATISQLAL
jgi:hypothetical protein